MKSSIFWDIMPSSPVKVTNVHSVTSLKTELFYIVISRNTFWNLICKLWVIFVLSVSSFPKDKNNTLRSEECEGHSPLIIIPLWNGVHTEVSVVFTHALYSSNFLSLFSTVTHCG
jgi:hypothetical protein